MNKVNARLFQVLVLGMMCTCSRTIFTMQNFFNAYGSQIKYCGITSGTTLAVSLFFSHVLYPVFSGHRKQAELARRAIEHAQDQVKLRNLYHDIEGKYNALNLPADVKSLHGYKKNLVADRAEITKILPFVWDSPVEKEVVIKLARHLDGLESQVERLIVARTVQDIKKDYKRELELVKTAHSMLDFQTMNKIVFEKYGHVQYKFGSYKSDLSQRIAQCKNIGATAEDIDELDLLEKLINHLFSQSLDNERIAQEKATRDQRLFDAELDNKVAVKDFYKEAQHHVANASHTVERFANEMDAQCKRQMSALEKCSLLLNSLSGLMSNWGVRLDQQTERLVYEVRQEGQTTREAAHNEVQTIRTNIAQVGNKVDLACDRANTAQQQAGQALQQAAQAQRQAAQAQQQAAHVRQHAVQAQPLPSAPALPINFPVPSAPPLEEVAQNQAQGECPVCLETKPLISFGACRHEICPHCKERVKKSSNNTCPLCRGPLGGDNFPLRK